MRVKGSCPKRCGASGTTTSATSSSMLVDEGTAIVKIFLNISPEEQRQRFQDRIDIPDERWKFRRGDLDDRALWPEYMAGLPRRSPDLDPRRPVVRRAGRPQVGAQPRRGAHPAPRPDPARPGSTRRPTRPGRARMVVRDRRGVTPGTVVLTFCTVAADVRADPTRSMDDAVSALGDASGRARARRRHRPDGRGQRGPPAVAGDETVVVASTASPSCASWTHRSGSRRTLRIGAGVTYAELPSRAARRAACRRWPRPRARSGRRRSATPARSAATSARARRPATGCPVLAALDAIVELRRRRRRAHAAGRRVHGRGQAHGARARRADRRGRRCRCSTAGRATPRSACATRWSSPSPAPASPSTDADALGARSRSVRSAPTIMRAPRRRGVRRRAPSTGTTRAVADDVGRRVRPSSPPRPAAPDRRPPLDRRLPPPRGRGAGRAACCGGRSRTADVTEHYALHVNGVDHDVADAWLGESLLYVLRERLGLLGAKGACEQGECGSCSVLVDGELVCSCLVLAASAVGQPIVTVEGLAAPGAPTDVQQAFVDAGAVQCGFCTPGLIDGRPRPARPHRRADRRSRSARSCPATSAAAPATAGSSTPCSGSPSRGGDGAS